VDFRGWSGYAPCGSRAPVYPMHTQRFGPPSCLVVFALALASAACGGGGGGGGGGVSPLPPMRVTVISPADGAQEVSVDADVFVTFSLPVAPSSIGIDAVRVGTKESGEVVGSILVVPDGTGRTLRFSATGQLFEDRSHSVLLSGELRSTAGDALAGDMAFSFHTSSGGGVVLPPPTALRPTTGRLNLGRRSHTATRLANDTVLLCGGFVIGTRVIDRAETFSPTTQTFTLVADFMTHPRASHTATVLKDGRVLLAGGWYEISAGNLNTTATAEIYNPSTGEFTETGMMTTARTDHAALRLPDGRVLVTGGSRLEGEFLADLSTAEVYDPATGLWTLWTSSMAHTRAVHGMVDLGDGRYLLVGGSEADLRPEIFDTLTGTFATFPPAAADTARYGAAFASFASGDVAVVGGEDRGDVLHFDRNLTRLINTGSPTSRPRAYATATRIGPDRVFVVGGLDYSNGAFVLATCDLVLEGGVAGSETYSTQVRFPTGMAGHTATLLGDNRVLFAGGLNENGGFPEHDAAYLFTPP
jgi:hypothetical protein